MFRYTEIRQIGVLMPGSPNWLPKASFSPGNSRRAQQRLRRRARRSCHRAIPPHQHGGDRAIDQDLQLHRQRFRLLDSEAVEQRTKPLPPLLLELYCDRARSVLRITQLSDRVDQLNR